MIPGGAQSNPEREWGVKVTFSERMGFKPAREVIQDRNISRELRNGLWNVLWMMYFSESHMDRSYRYTILTQQLVSDLWYSLFKEPLDTLPEYWERIADFIKRRFFSYQWNEGVRLHRIRSCFYQESELR